MNKAKGFTLIELMVVVVIVAILAAVAIPSYQSSIQKTRRADAKETLTRIAAAQERFFFTNNSYTSDLTKLGLNAAGDSTEGYYTVSLITPANKATISGAESKVFCTTGSTNHPCFTITATPKVGGPQSKDAECKTFQIIHTGSKTAKGGADGNVDNTEKCW